MLDQQDYLDFIQIYPDWSLSIVSSSKITSILQRFIAALRRKVNENKVIRAVKSKNIRDQADLNNTGSRSLENFIFTQRHTEMENEASLIKIRRTSTLLKPASPKFETSRKNLLLEPSSHSQRTNRFESTPDDANQDLVMPSQSELDPTGILEIDFNRKSHVLNASKYNNTKEERFIPSLSDFQERSKNPLHRVELEIEKPCIRSKNRERMEIKNPNLRKGILKMSQFEEATNSSNKYFYSVNIIAPLEKSNANIDKKEIFAQAKNRYKYPKKVSQDEKIITSQTGMNVLSRRQTTFQEGIFF